MKDARKQPLSSIRMPEELKKTLKYAAVDNRRSFNDEIIVRLEQSIKAGSANATVAA